MPRLPVALGKYLAFHSLVQYYLLGSALPQLLPSDTILLHPPSAADLGQEELKL